VRIIQETGVQELQNEELLSSASDLISSSGARKQLLASLKLRAELFSPGSWLLAPGSWNDGSHRGQRGVYRYGRIFSQLF
jgi:hypothetical protein